MDTSKVCCTCKKKKSLTEFGKSDPRCKTCITVKNKKYYESNQDQLRSKNRSRYEDENIKEQIKATSRDYYYNNIEKVKATQKIYRAADLERERAHRKNSKESRRATLRGITSNLTAKQRNEVWEEFEGMCFWCGTEADGLDHIVPLCPRAGTPQGHHTKSNVVPACHPCNKSKSNKDPLMFLFDRRKVNGI